jgi:hypothetical protein
MRYQTRDHSSGSDRKRCVLGCIAERVAVAKQDSRICLSSMLLSISPVNFLCYCMAFPIYRLDIYPIMEAVMSDRLEEQRVCRHLFLCDSGPIWILDAHEIRRRYFHTLDHCREGSDASLAEWLYKRPFDRSFCSQFATQRQLDFRSNPIELFSNSNANGH